MDFYEVRQEKKKVHTFLYLNGVNSGTKYTGMDKLGDK